MRLNELFPLYMNTRQHGFWVNSRSLARFDPRIQLVNGLLYILITIISCSTHPGFIHTNSITSGDVFVTRTYFPRGSVSIRSPVVELWVAETSSCSDTLSAPSWEGDYTHTLVIQDWSVTANRQTDGCWSFSSSYLQEETVWFNCLTSDWV